MADSPPTLKPVSISDDPKVRELRRLLMRHRIRRTDVDVTAEVDELLNEFNGDARAALAALLIDLDTIVADYEATISAGYVRRGLTGSHAS